MGEIIFKFMSEEDREKYREKYSDLMEALKRMLNGIHRRCARKRSV